MKGAVMISIKDLKELLAFENGGDRITTLALNVDGRRFPKRDDYMVVFKNLVKKTRDALKAEPIDREARQSIDEDLTKMERYLRDQFDRNQDRGVLIFSCSRKGLWRPFAFPVPLRSNLTIDLHPYTRPLTSLLDKYERYCAVIVSSERARIFDVYLGEMEEHSEIFDELPGKVQDPSSREYKSLEEYGLAERKIERRSRRSGSGISGGEYGLAESRIERHTEEHVKKHLRRVAETTFSFFEDHAFDHLILGGQAEILADFEPMLHNYLKSRLIGKINADPKISLPHLLKETQELIQQIEWEEKDRIIREIADASQQGGLGVLGRRATFDALKQRAVYRLIVQEEFRASGALCPICNYVAAQSGACPRCGAELQPVADLVEEAVEQAISQDAQIYHISSHPILDVREGIGARLRFSLSEAAPASSGQAA